MTEKLAWALYVAGVVLALSMWFAGAADAAEEKEVTTNMVFYMHDVPVAANPSAIPVAAAQGNLSNRGQGLTFVFDDKLTEGADPVSAVVGAGQGVYTVAASSGDVSSTVLLLVFTAVFQAPERISGSTLCLHGADILALSVREVAVTGGTGVFRFARGYATIETASSSANGLNVALKFNATFLTPSSLALSSSASSSSSSSSTPAPASSTSAARISFSALSLSLLCILLAVPA